MKTAVAVLWVVLMFVTVTCKRENIYDGIYFASQNNVYEILVPYNEIHGYDSTKNIFQLAESSWKRILHNTENISPERGFGFNVILNHEIIYSAKFVPGYISASYHDIITFIPAKPNLIIMQLGYPHSPELYTGRESPDDPELIARLGADGKLVEIEN